MVEETSESGSQVNEVAVVNTLVNGSMAEKYSMGPKLPNPIGVTTALAISIPCSGAEKVYPAHFFALSAYCRLKERA